MRNVETIRDIRVNLGICGGLRLICADLRLWGADLNLICANQSLVCANLIW
jgi:hypothetical protein